MAKPKKPPGKKGRRSVPPPPPQWARAPGVPEPVDPVEDTATTTSIVTLDEVAFMNEVCARLNAFLATYPEEAQHLFQQFLPYRHELVSVHQEMRRVSRMLRGLPPENPRPPAGVTLANLFVALLQTHHGNGYVIQPVTVIHEGQRRITRFVVKHQEQLDSENSA